MKITNINQFLDINPKLARKKNSKVAEVKDVIKIITISKDQAKLEIKNSLKNYANWFKANNFNFNTNSWIFLPELESELKNTQSITTKKILAIVDPSKNLYPVIGKIAKQTKNQTLIYDIDASYTKLPENNLALSFGLGAYKYELTNKLKSAKSSKLKVATSPNFLSSYYIGRDLINCPSNIKSPKVLADFAKTLAKKHNAKITIFDKSKIKTKFPLLSAVAQGGRDPYFVEINYTNSNKSKASTKKNRPKVNLVGKGVIFDTGGLGIKSSSNMFLMKKDMGGFASVITLFDMIANNKLDIDLNLYLPLTDNSISRDSFRPSDVITAFNKTTVEIGHTDAEGRLILADALAYAASKANKDDLIIDFATLTGAARVALGTELPNMFGSNDKICHEIQEMSLTLGDPLWHMPLWYGYMKNLKSDIADINNISNDIYGGAIHAALFLKSFIPDHENWLHIDFMGFNRSSKSPLSPKGGEVQGVFTIYKYLEKLSNNKL